MVVLKPSSTPYRRRTAADGSSSRSGSSPLSGASPGGRNGSRAAVRAVSAGDGSGSGSRASVRTVATGDGSGSGSRAAARTVATGDGSGSGSRAAARTVVSGFSSESPRGGNALTSSTGPAFQRVNPVPSTNLPAPTNAQAVQEAYDSLLEYPKLQPFPKLRLMLKSTMDRIRLETSFKDYMDALEVEYKAFGGTKITAESSPFSDQMIKSLYTAEKKVATFLDTSAQNVWDECKLKALHTAVKSTDGGYKKCAVRDILFLVKKYYPDITSAVVEKKMKEMRAQRPDGKYNFETAISKFGSDSMWTDELNAKLLTSIGPRELLDINDPVLKLIWERFEDLLGAAVVERLKITADDVNCRIRHWQNNIKHHEQAKSKAIVDEALPL